MDCILVTNQEPNDYIMAARTDINGVGVGVDFDDITTLHLCLIFFFLFFGVFYAYM